jgi:hypothetical protein
LNEATRTCRIEHNKNSKNELLSHYLVYEFIYQIFAHWMTVSLSYTRIRSGSSDGWIHQRLILSSFYANKPELWFIAMALIFPCLCPTFGSRRIDFFQFCTVCIQLRVSIISPLSAAPQLQLLFSKTQTTKK